MEDMPSYGRFGDEATGRTVTMAGGVEEMAAALKSLSPDDGEAVERLFSGARAHGSCGFPEATIGYGIAQPFGVKLAPPLTPSGHHSVKHFLQSVAQACQAKFTPLEM